MEYSVDITATGVADSQLAKALNDTSQLVALVDRPPETEAALRRRATNDLPRLTQIMHAAGYWKAKASFAVDDAEKKPKVTVTIDPGPLFRFSAVAVRTPDGAPAALFEKQGLAQLGLKPGDPALSEVVANANDKIVAAYGHEGQPFAKIADRRAVIDVATNTMTVTYVVAPGAPARFGPTRISKMKRTKEGFVLRRIEWHSGAPYDSRLVEKTRQSLVDAGLFSEVRIVHADAPDAAGEVPMTITLVEAPPRSVGAGVGYNTMLGLGTRAFWEHRDLFGEGDRLRLSAAVAQKELGLDATFRRPDVLGRGIDLLTDAGISRQKTPAYQVRSASVSAGLEDRQIDDYVFGAGLAAETAYLTESEFNESYSLLSLPLYVQRDGSDNLLNPTSGTRETLTLTPYRSFAGPDITFVSSRFELRGYYQPKFDDHVVLAGFGALGSIVGEGLGAVPLDKRLFAGGAGSVRGYGYQLAGPIDSSGRPTGGLSSLELGGELRYRITETIGIVPFVEGGNVYPTSLPNSGKLFYGAGLGLRYYTPIGPVRLDLATPLERRPIDSPIQVYISLGQAF